MNKLISGLLAIIFFVLLGFGGVIVWDVTSNDAKITNTIFTPSNDNSDSNNKLPTISDEDDQTDIGFLTSNLKFCFKTDTVYNGVNVATIENEKTAAAGIVNNCIAYERENVAEGYNPTIYSLRWDLGSTDITIFTVGTYLRCAGDMRILVRAVPSSSVPYSLDIFSQSTRYRLIDDKIKDVYESALDCGYINFEIGAVKYNNVAYFGFRFSTDSEELTYFSDNSGTIKNETLMFACANSNSSSGENVTLKSLLAGFGYSEITNTNSSYGLGAGTMVSYNTETSATYVSAENSSKWFKNKVIDLI